MMRMESKRLLGFERFRPAVENKMALITARTQGKSIESADNLRNAIL